MVEIHCKRLVLKKPELKDVPQLVSGLGDIEVAKFMANVRHPYRPEDALNWVNRNQTC